MESETRCEYTGDSSALYSIIKNLIQPEDRIDSLVLKKIKGSTQSSLPNRKATIIFYSPRE